MAHFAIDLIVFRCKQDMIEAEETFDKYWLLTSGVQDDSGYVEELDKALEKWVAANDKMAALSIIIHGRQSSGVKKESEIFEGLDRPKVAH